MKHFIVILSILFTAFSSYAQSVAINEDASTAHHSALLDVKSSTKGMLVPRMSTVERTGIADPLAGLLVFDNDTESFWYYKTIGWTELVTGGGGGVSYWDTDGTHIYNNNTGNVGIGTNNPYTRLTMESPYNTSGWYHIGRDGTDSIVVGEGIGGVSAAIGTSTEHIFRLTAGALGRMQMIPDGNVIVGDNFVPPFGRFTVRTPNNSYGISHTSNEGNILATRIGGTSAGIGTFTDTHMRIFANSVSAITITGSTGNVGIGTEFSTYKLAVNGTIRAKELRINTGWADYVFAKNYKLMPLAKVEAFIKTNKRLPGIAPASKLKKEGVGVSEMQTKMMAKIEELTLYLIEANKTIESLQLRMKAVENTKQ